MKLENIFVTDLAGVVYKGRVELMDPDKERFARETYARTLADVMEGADVFLGLSAGGVLKPEMVKGMGTKPLILALANPTPEILPELALEVRPDAVLATGRTDYPNQVNNVLCFPFIFRGALDAGATTDHARDGNRRRERDCGTGASGTKRYRRDGLWHSGFVVRSRVPDSEAVRPAPDREDRAGRRQGCDGFRRRDASDRGHGSLRAASAAVRLPQRHDDEAGVPARAQRRAGEEAHRVRGRRGRARAARSADRRRREDRAIRS